MNRLERLAAEVEPMKERILDIIDKHGYGQLLFTMAPDEEDIRLLDEYSVPIKAYRELWLTEIYSHPDDHPDYDWNETDFRGFTEGFMIALGVPVLDAKRLDTFLRYNMQYFEPEYDKLTKANSDKEDGGADD